jgi:plasmid stabilization system protein ParE
VIARVRFEPEAAAELEEAAAWYEERRAGLGLTFIAAVDRALDAVAAWPAAGSPVPGVDADLMVRRVLLGRFPYQLIYESDRRHVRVLAVAHERRRPGYYLRDA